MARTTTIGIGVDWAERIKAISTERGTSNRRTLEWLLDFAMGKLEQVAEVAESVAPVVEDVVEWVPVAEIAAEVERVLDEADEPEPVVEGDPMAIVTPVVTSTPGQRDFDPVATGCPACERGAPRKGALHNCGKPNPNLGEGRPGL